MAKPKLQKQLERKGWNHLMNAQAGSSQEAVQSLYSGLHPGYEVMVTPTLTQDRREIPQTYSVFLRKQEE